MNIPEAMIQAARDERQKHDARIVDDGDYGWIWLCECGATGHGEDEDDCSEEADCHEVGAGLTAALATCTVREQWRAKISRPTAATYTVWWQDRGDAESFVALFHRGHLGRDSSATVTVESRLVIETAAIPQPERTTGE